MKDTVRGVLVGGWADEWRVRMDSERPRLVIEPPPGTPPVVYEFTGTRYNGVRVYEPQKVS